MDNFHKTMPSTFFKDKEELYQTTLFCKKENTDLNKTVFHKRLTVQIKRLKTKINSLYAELSKRDKLIESYLNNSLQESQLQEQCILASYKAQILELNRKVETLKEEKLRVEKSLPFTQLEELQIELNTYIRECERLRSFVDAQMTNNEIQNHFTDIYSIRSAQKEGQLGEEIRHLREEMAELSRENEELKKKLNEMARDNYKKSVDLKKITRKQLRETMPPLGRRNSETKSLAGPEPLSCTNPVELKQLLMEQRMLELKKEVQRLYLPKIKYILQSLALQNDQEFDMRTISEQELRDLLRDYLPVVDAIIDKQFVEGSLKEFHPMTKEILTPLKHYLSDLTQPFGDQVHEMVGVDQLECGSNVKDFLRYIGYQSFESSQFFSRQVLLGYLLKVCAHNQEFEVDLQVQALNRTT